MTQNIKQPIVLAAGGTGGHIFPAEALAEALVARGERVVLITDKRFGNFKTGIFSELEVRTIHAGSPAGGGLHKKIIGAAGLTIGIFQAGSLLRQLKPKAVVGFGGYPSFPTVFAAGGQSIFTIIHEQNSVLGRANRLVARFARVLALSFESTAGVPLSPVPRLITGNPTRPGFAAQSPVADPSRFRLLVLGGSQGARQLNEHVPEALARGLDAVAAAAG
mgnify:CR=1 FL=1